MTPYNFVTTSFKCTVSCIHVAPVLSWFVTGNSRFLDCVCVPVDGEGRGVKFYLSHDNIV